MLQKFHIQIKIIIIFTDFILYGWNKIIILHYIHSINLNMILLDNAWIRIPYHSFCIYFHYLMLSIHVIPQAVGLFPFHRFFIHMETK